MNKKLIRCKFKECLCRSTFIIGEDMQLTYQVFLVVYYLPIVVSIESASSCLDAKFSQNNSSIGGGGR